MAIRFPSINYLAIQAWQSFLRFPLIILSSVVAVILALYLIETGSEVFNRFPYVNAMLCAALGISLYFCVTLFGRRQNFNATQNILSLLAATAILAGIYFSLPNMDSTHNISQPYIRFVLYSIIIHLMVSFIPFLSSYQLNGFWNYNKTLFLRFLISLLYSGFLYVGLVLALVALKILFDVNIPDKLFFQLFVVFIGLFNTWFFVAGIPLDFDELDGITTYPKGLQVFTQYVLLPLLGLYLLILYGYGLKIILSWNWPKGIVSYLIMAVSVLGIFTILLIHPYAIHAGNQWIRRVSKGYYLLLLPLMVLLFLAIGMRLADYGFTVNRYLILATGIWLTTVCLYFIAGQSNIKFVPISLALFLLVISFGPWGIFSVSEKSQVKRLEAILIEGNIIRNGKVFQEVKWVNDSLPIFFSPNENLNDGILNDSLHNEVYSILNYLDSYHGMNLIEQWYEQPLDSMITVAEADTSKFRVYVSEDEVYMRSLGMPHSIKWKSDYDEKYFTYSSKTSQTLDVKGYDQLVYLGQIYSYSTNHHKNAVSSNYRRTMKLDGYDYIIEYNPLESNLLRIYTTTDTIYFSLGHRIQQLNNKYLHETNRNIPSASLRIDTINHDKNYRLILDDISFLVKSDSISVESISGKLLIGKRN